MLPPSSTMPGSKLAHHLETLRYAAGDAIVVAPIVVLGPAVEEPIGDGDFAASGCERRSGNSRASSFGWSANGRTPPRSCPRRISRERAGRSFRARHLRPGCGPFPRGPAAGRCRRRPTGMGANFPGQSVRSCGQASQVASCGSHSAGMRTEFALASIQPPLQNRARRHRCGGRAGMASRGEPLPCDADRIPPRESLHSKWRLRR